MEAFCKNCLCSADALLSTCNKDCPCHVYMNDRRRKKEQENKKSDMELKIYDILGDYFIEARSLNLEDKRPIVERLWDVIEEYGK